MSLKLKNNYFLLRHGKNIHQTTKKDIIYEWPDDPEPCVLLEEGKAEAEAAGYVLKNQNINLIFCSDVCRTKKTAEIVAEIIGFSKNKIIYDARLRDINWGILGGKTKKQAWEFFNGDPLRKFEQAVPQGESWNDCQSRVLNVLTEIENKYAGNNILIVSHGDPLWLLECYFKGLNYEEALKYRERLIKTGEVRKL